MKLIPLTQGKFAMVDDADYESVNAHKWFAMEHGREFCAARNILRPDGKRRVQYMHRFLMPGVAEVDHKNGDALNNSREKNLRPVTHQQNMRGFRRKAIGKTSRFRGVSWDRSRFKWKAEIEVDGKRKFLGRFDSEEDAARARDAAARKYFGDGAHLNFP